SPSRILISRSFRNALADAAPGSEAALVPAGTFTDSGLRTHELFRPDPHAAPRRARRYAALTTGAVVVLLAAGVAGRVSKVRQANHKRSVQEAKAAGKLTPPHIVTTYDFGEEGALAYLAMELLEGTDLRERLLKASLPTADAVDIAYQVADGLAFAHERGVVHRDIKPGNIMLLARGQVKIMDFGIARMRSDDFKTSTGIVLGTPSF